MIFELRIQLGDLVTSIIQTLRVARLFSNSLNYVNRGPKRWSVGKGIGKEA